MHPLDLTSLRRGFIGTVVQFTGCAAPTYPPAPLRVYVPAFPGIANGAASPAGTRATLSAAAGARQFTPDKEDTGCPWNRQAFHLRYPSDHGH